MKQRIGRHQLQHNGYGIERANMLHLPVTVAKIIIIGLLNQPLFDMDKLRLIDRFRSHSSKAS